MAELSIKVRFFMDVYAISILTNRLTSYMSFFLSQMNGRFFEYFRSKFSHIHKLPTH